uniref:(northern house mosquito) hypothetical protein n=1 Tax=Culex pipiens TaxID=7175 RepID=A0A8D8CE80_CULPI
MRRPQWRTSRTTCSGSVRYSASTRRKRRSSPGCPLRQSCKGLNQYVEQSEIISPSLFQSSQRRPAKATRHGLQHRCDHAGRQRRHLCAQRRRQSGAREAVQGGQSRRHDGCR